MHFENSTKVLRLRVFALRDSEGRDAAPSRDADGDEEPKEKREEKPSKKQLPLNRCSFSFI